MKKCYKCRQEKEETEFHRNKTKPDGLQNYCKSCQKITYPTILRCTECGNDFTVKHRNIRKRKTSLCQACVIKEVIRRNKEGAIGQTISTKGYRYVADIKEKCGYILSHRKEMERHLKRKLQKGEVVHHIDCDPLNNEIGNLWLTNNSNHHKAHSSLEGIARELYRKGLIAFDATTGQYRLIKEL